jgi:hypothetical protein
MNITLFLRASTDVYSEPCDVAAVPVYAANGSPAGYIGAAWGEHTPESALRYHHCEPEDVADVLEGWGLHRAPVDPIGGI